GGYEAWCVGGAVRDALLGQHHLDWDIATSATPDQVRRTFRRTIPIGVEFGTVGVLDRTNVMHEVTTFRRDVETDGRHAVVKFGVSLEDDLARRDFTINAIAWSPTRGQLFDPFDGAGDLERGLLRTVGEAGMRMAEDRLRALRAFRFAARFGFSIDPETWSAVAASAKYLSRLSAERVKQEIEKTMDQVSRPGTAFRMWMRSGALRELVPAISRASDLELGFADFLAQPRLPNRPARRINRITALLLPAGKHAHDTLRALRFSNSDVAWVSGQVERWQSTLPDLEASLGRTGTVPPAALRRWISSVGRMRAPALLRVAVAVWCARQDAGDEVIALRHARALYGRVVRSSFRDPLELGDLKVDGDDLREAGVPPGPRLGKLLNTLLGHVLEDPSLNDRDKLMALSRQLSSETNDGGRRKSGSGDGKR
ncbi:MAG TPA: CCA tRNA nucleotidyltransferase, partial [Woeseiaceae bacterium]|nr:CCA tRNA nucleotidyltransferase [Woeseiaceae bacterium]